MRNKDIYVRIAVNYIHGEMKVKDLINTLYGLGIGFLGNTPWTRYQPEVVIARAKYNVFSSITLRLHRYLLFPRKREFIL
jgi:hypothetical protein